MNCKNCGNETKGKNVYCSYSCRNIYVNKNLRDYTKNGDAISLNSKNNYYKNPKYCKVCGNAIPYDRKEDSQYCSRECSKTQINKNRKGLKHNLSEEGRSALVKTALVNFFNKRGINPKYEENRKEYFDNPKKCLNCECILDFKKRKNIFCNINCKKEYYVNNIEEYKLYYKLSKFKFNLKDYNNEFNFDLIKEHGWYKAKNNGDNINGVSRDHKFSVREGFRRLINPLLIAHPANCELIINRENQSKCDDCSLTIDELLNNIKTFEDKYGKYYDKDIEIFIDLEKLKLLYKENISG